MIISHGGNVSTVKAIKLKLRGYDSNLGLFFFFLSGAGAGHVSCEILVRRPHPLHWHHGFPGGLAGKEPACQCRRCKQCRLDPWAGKISLGGRHGNPLQYSGLEKPHGQRSLVGYNSWDRKESDTTEQLTHGKVPTQVY